MDERAPTAHAVPSRRLRRPQQPVTPPAAARSASGRTTTDGALGASIEGHPNLENETYERGEGHEFPKVPESVRPALAVAGTTLLGAFALAAAGAILLGAFAPSWAAPEAAAHAGAVYGLTFDRAWITVVALLALAAAVIGGLGLARSVRGTGTGRKGAIVALVAGPLGMVGGVLNLALADGGPGTGNGVVGGVLALLLGLAATVLGGLTLARYRRTS